ncbi:MAG: hypothetical protein GY738_09635 [Pseudoalteromonas sp.]|nr:hypothetical protein [Pseudoalteromonas sp.]
MTVYTGPGKAGGTPATLDNRSTVELLEWLRKKKDVVDAPLQLREENNELCLAYALVLGTTFVEKGLTEMRILGKAYARLRRAATQLCFEANLTPNIQMGLEELEVLSKTNSLKKFRIIAYTEKAVKFFDSGPIGRDTGIIYLVLCCNHFMMVRSFKL